MAESDFQWARKPRPLIAGTSFEVKVRAGTHFETVVRPAFIVHRNQGEVRPHLLQPYSTVSAWFSRTVWARNSRQGQARISREHSVLFRHSFQGVRQP